MRRCVVEYAVDLPGGAGMMAQAVASLLMAAALVVAPGPAGPRSRLPLTVDAGGQPGLERSAWGLRFRRNADDQQLDLAAAWELLAACLWAGMPVAVGLSAIAQGIDAPAGPALRRTAQLLALGADPTQAWQPALKCPATARIASFAQRSGRGGSALAESLTRVAAQLRATAQQQAEARAQRAGVLIAAPLGLCFLPAFLAIGVAPVLIGLGAGLAVQW
jgi:pilus assembly protein TadC